MLNRHNSMTSIHHHQPVMPFKWRPFDLYNDIHVNDTQSLPKQQQQLDTSVCERPMASNCVQSYQCEFNHHHSHLDQHAKEHQRKHWQRHRQSSRGSSSGGSSGSCASISTVGRYFVNDIDNSESNMDSTIVSCGSIDCFCCKLDSQRITTSDKMYKSTKQQQQQEHQQSSHRQSDCSKCYAVKCCTPNCLNNSSKYTKIVNNNSVHKNSKNSNSSLVNRVVVMPFDGIDYTYKCEQSMIGILNHCESPAMTTTITPTTTKISTNSNENNNNCTAFDHCVKTNHCCHAGYFDNNWMIGHKKQPNTDNSKYIFM